jgi:ribose transport system substrate-binding protein
VGGVRRIRHRFLVGALVAALAATFAVAGCGGDDDEDEAGAPATTETAATETGEAEGGDIVAEARAMIDAAKEPLEFEPPGPAIDASSLEGKRILVLSVDQRVPTLAQAAGVMQEAGEAAGLRVDIFDAKSNVAQMQQGLDQAVRQADAAILLGIPIALVGPGLQAAADADVPTVSVLNNEPEMGEPGQGAGDENVYATTAPSYFRGGQLVAAKAIVDTEGEAKVVIFNTSEITPSAPSVEGIKSMLEQCDTCEIVDENDTPLAEWSTALTPKAVSAIRQNPDVNYLLPIFDGMGIFVHAGILQAGAGDRVKVAAFNGTPAALEIILQGEAFTGDPGQPNGWLGWHAVDQAMRGMLGLEPGDPEIPIRFFDESNLEGVDVNDLDEPYGSPDYRSGFQELWGVAG